VVRGCHLGCLLSQFVATSNQKALTLCLSHVTVFFLPFSGMQLPAITDTQLTAGESQTKKNVLNKNKCGPVVKIIDQKKKTCVENQK
jgi:hypothetical protein